MSNTKSQRTCELRVRCTDEEKNQILAKAEAAGRGKVAQWMRETCLGVEDSRKVAPADPQLIAAINRVGNNLNQIARRINSVADPVSAVEVISKLEEIEQQMTGILDIESQRNAG